MLSLFYISKLDKKALRLQEGQSVQKIPPVMKLENVDDESEISDVESNDNQEKKRKSQFQPAPILESGVVESPKNKNRRSSRVAKAKEGSNDGLSV